MRLKDSIGGGEGIGGGEDGRDFVRSLAQERRLVFSFFGVFGWSKGDGEDGMSTGRDLVESCGAKVEDLLGGGRSVSCWRRETSAEEFDA